MRTDIAKYFWDLNERALRDTERILKNPQHNKFTERLVTFLSRCDRPKELFSLISKKEFCDVWPKVKAYWIKIARTSEFRDWWQTIYEQILYESNAKEIRLKGNSSILFLKIGSTIRNARIRKGLSQGELAFRTYMKQPDISMIEKGKKNITLETLACLCKVLDIKTVEL